ENFLAELQALQMQVTDGQGRLLFLGGEAGIGKSALLSEFGRLSKAAVLAGACDSLTTPRPLGPLLDMAGDARSGLSRREVTSSPRDEVFAAFLERLKSTTEPLVVIFEDVHWADEATLDLLRFLGRRLERARALLI